MSLLNWLSPKSGSRHTAGTTTPAISNKTASKLQRATHRDLLYPIIRESMVRAGILSSRYKFKVLSADTRGQKFLVMMDLAPDIMEHSDQLAQIETLIAHHAAARHHLQVLGTYWRVNHDLEPVNQAPTINKRRGDGILGATQYGELV